MLRHESLDHDWTDVLKAQDVNREAVSISADPYAGKTASNGKEIWSPQEAADNLNRTGVNYTFGNAGALDDGVLTFGFWDSLEEVQNSYYLEPLTDPATGEKFLLADGFYIAEGKFAAFTEEQREMARANIQLWDDLIAVEFREESSAEAADITFGFVQMSPAAGAHAYYPQEDAWNEFYGTVESGKASGDVWANFLHKSSFSGQNTEIGAYGWQAITHEIGHSLGLAHGGDYNASDDNDGDGVPDPITYQGDAYFFQDSQQYTIMSYFDGRVTGQAAVRWTNTGGTFMYIQTPAVHDILAVQNVYGADYTTRSGDTVYGFNSTADRAVFDFSQNDVPIVTIWDGGGNDTLDLSGFNADAVIDLHEGAFSSAGYAINDQSLAYWARQGIDTQAELDAFFARNGLGPDGRPVDNIAIAYGAEIENAVGGIGDDRITGNALNNRLAGLDGNDSLFGEDGADRLEGGNGADALNGGNGNDVLVGGAGNDVLTGGRGVDSFVFTDGGTDRITDYSRGERIDLSALGVTASDVTISRGRVFVELGDQDLIIQVSGTVSEADLFFG